jgi:hypothetical protein
MQRERRKTKAQKRVWVLKECCSFVSSFLPLRLPKAMPIAMKAKRTVQSPA